MKKLLILFVSVLFSFQVDAQNVKTATIFPYKIIGLAPERTILSGNTTTPFNFVSETIGQVLQKAIQNNNKVLITYDPATLSIKKVRSVRLTKLQAFLFKHRRLSIGKFRFNQLKSFSRNESDYTKALLETKPVLTQIIPSNQIEPIFRYFQSLSCNRTLNCDKKNPCISYNYKVDGCFARAHMMRKILAEKYKFDCQKIFIEGNLRVINSGSCGRRCVKWAWHVALYVQTNDAAGHKIGLVIDPSLFDRACSIKEWSTVQGISCCTSCQPGAPGIPYLKPSFVYTPKDTTDDDYLGTYQTLYDCCRECH